MSGAVLFIYSTHPRKEVSAWRSSFSSCSSYFRSCKLVRSITGPRSSRGLFSSSFRSLSLFCSASHLRTKTTTTARKIEPECSSERRCLRWPEKALRSAWRSCSSSSFSLMEEAKSEADAIRSSIKAEMEERGVEELQAGSYIIRWTSVLSTRFDSAAFKRVHDDLYKAFTKQVASRRFSISA